MQKIKFLISFIFLSNIVSAQSQNSGSDWVLYGLIGLCTVLILWALLLVVDTLMKIEASKHGLDVEKDNFGIFLGMDDIFKKK